MATLTGIVADPLRAQEYVDWAKDPRAGAVVSFSGITRDTFDGKSVVSLAYDAYVPLAEKTLAHIANQAVKREGVVKVALKHRIGIVPLSEESIVIVVASAHRKEGWAAAEWILEEVKASAEIWKKEQYTSGDSAWIDGTQRVLS